MSKHTPGPWRVFPAREMICAESGEVIVYEMNSNEADSHLIAAAPEMYEALKAFLEVPDVQNEREWPETAIARAVIAKAEGGERA